MGLGRSRLLEAHEDVSIDAATTARTDGKKSNQGDVKRGNLKIKSFEETKMLKNRNLFYCSQRNPNENHKKTRRNGGTFKSSFISKRHLQGAVGNQ